MWKAHWRVSTHNACGCSICRSERKLAAKHHKNVIIKKVNFHFYNSTDLKFGFRSRIDILKVCRLLCSCISGAYFFLKESAISVSLLCIIYCNKLTTTLCMKLLKNAFAQLQDLTITCLYKFCMCCRTRWVRCLLLLSYVVMQRKAVVTMRSHRWCNLCSWISSPP